MKNKIQSIIGIVVVSAFIAGSVFAEGPGACQSGKDKSWRKDKKEEIAAKLNLTAEQEKLLNDAKAAHRTEMEALRKAMKEKRQELKDALANPVVTRQQVEPIAAEIKGLQSQMVDSRIDGIFKIKTILSPEQFQKLQGMKEEWQKNKHDKHSRALYSD